MSINFNYSDLYERATTPPFGDEVQFIYTDIIESDTDSDSDSDYDNENNYELSTTNFIELELESEESYQSERTIGNFSIYIHPDEIMNKNFEIICDNMEVDKYYEKVEKLRLSTHFTFIKKIIDIITNIYPFSIIFGDIISTLYMYDHFKDTEFNSMNIKYTQLYILYDSKNGIEKLINKISFIVNINYQYSLDNKNIIFFTVKDEKGYVYNIYLHLFYIPNIFCNLLKTTSPYANREKVELNLTKNDMKKLHFLNRFLHHRIGIIYNTWKHDYVALEEKNNKYFLDCIENTNIENCIFDKKLKYIENEDIDIINPYKELEIFLNNIDFSNSIILSRLNMFINSNIIMYFVQKGWKYENINKIEFDHDDCCFICSNKKSDFLELNKNLDVYKISVNCCKESIKGICASCFVKNSMECYKKLKSCYLCPFCKKEHIFYNKVVNDFILKNNK